MDLGGCMKGSQSDDASELHRMTGLPHCARQGFIYTMSVDPNKGCPAMFVFLQAPLRQACSAAGPAEIELCHYLGGGGDGGGDGGLGLQIGAGSIVWVNRVLDLQNAPADCSLAVAHAVDETDA